MTKIEAGDNETSQSIFEPLFLSESDLMTIRWQVLDDIRKEQCIFERELICGGKDGARSGMAAEVAKD